MSGRLKAGKLLPINLPPEDSAKIVGLRYVSDTGLGIQRRSNGQGFQYVDADNKAVRDRKTLDRIKSLAIPPAWNDVWICGLENGHLQASGRDARKRKQYRYHTRWREVRDETKYNRTLAFAKILPKVRRRVSKDMRLPGLPKNKVVATVVRLLEASLVRVGNEEYARANHSYGLTTLRDHHVKINGSQLQFHFRGKSGKDHTVYLEDRRLARIVRNCQAIPGQELFQFFDDSGQRQKIDSGDVNNYLREITGEDFSAKDFRTWAGTVLAALALSEFEKFDSQVEAKKNVLRAIENVAQRLGNTPAVCRRCYIHPGLLDAYLDGSMLDTLRQRAEDQIRTSLTRLRPEEASVLTLLQQRLRAERNGTLLKNQLAASLKTHRSSKRGAAKK